MPRLIKRTPVLQDSGESIKGVSIAKEALADSLPRGERGTSESVPASGIEPAWVGMVKDNGSGDGVE